MAKHQRKDMEINVEEDGAQKNGDNTKFRLHTKGWDRVTSPFLLLQRYK